ncbi:UL47 [anatid alphaherpesvirus 1]|nr:UL47 [Anatid alphaherpesvirus 1]WKE35593.1 UL47 [Anatid alphaherpesvirus 1]
MDKSRRQRRRSSTPNGPIRSARKSEDRRTSTDPYGAGTSRRSGKRRTLDRTELPNYFDENARHGFESDDDEIVTMELDSGSVEPRKLSKDAAGGLWQFISHAFGASSSGYEQHQGHTSSSDDEYIERRRRIRTCRDVPIENTHSEEEDDISDNISRSRRESSKRAPVLDKAPSVQTESRPAYRHRLRMGDRTDDTFLIGHSASCKCGCRDRDSCLLPNEQVSENDYNDEMDSVPMEDSSSSGTRSSRRFVKPRELALEETEGSLDMDMFNRYEAESSDSHTLSPKMLPSLDGRILLGDLLNRLPFTELISPVNPAIVLGEDRLFFMRNWQYGDVVGWINNKSDENLPGAMYFGRPTITGAMYERTLIQAYLLVHSLTDESLHYSVKASAITAPSAVFFLLDAAVLVAKNCHATIRSLDRGSSLLKQLPGHVSTLLHGGPVSPVNGPTAAIIRSSYGSALYWPDIRAAFEPVVRPICRYALVKMLDGDVFLFSVFNPLDKSASVNELRVASLCLTLGTMAAEAMVRLIYLGIGRALHRDGDDKVFQSITEIMETSLFPLGTELAAMIEEDALYDIDGVHIEDIPFATAALNTYIAVRSSATELLGEHIEAYGSIESYDVPATAIHCILATTVVLQRYLGHLNFLLCFIAHHALNCGIGNITIRENTLSRYKWLMTVTSSLYRHVTMEEFLKDYEDAMRELSISPNSHTPSGRGEGTITILPHTPTLDLLRGHGNGRVRSRSHKYLGVSVPFEEAINEQRILVLGKSTSKALKRRLTGGRVPKSGRRELH